MTENLQKYLDGELPIEALSAAERAEAERFDALLAESSALRSDRAPRWLETRVMATLPAAPYRSRWSRWFQWLLAPQPVRVRPVSLALAGAATVLALMVVRQDNVVVEPVSSPGNISVQTVSATAPAVIYVQFVLANRDAKSVAVAGEFNDWNVSATQLTDSNGDGVWTGLVALRPGLHKYMFVVDGETWVTDPEAERYIDDGFGMRNAVITVTPPVGRSI